NGITGRDSTVRGYDDSRGPRQPRTEANQRGQLEEFAPRERQLIRECMAVGQSGLPPGLAKKDRLPPGLERQLQRNGTLPPGLQKRVQPLQYALEQQLPAVLIGMRGVVLAGHVILLDEGTARIVDLIRDVF